MYDPSGCSFDFWLHMPNFTSANNDFEVKVFDNGLDASSEVSSLNLYQDNASWTDFNFFKAIIANENTGGIEIDDSGSVVNNLTTDYTRGMFIGFTRAPIFTVGAVDIDGDTDIDYPNPPGTLNPVENYGTYVTAADTPTNTYFVIAPMQSFSKDGCSFIRQDDCDIDGSMYRGLSIPITTNAPGGTSFRDSSTKFIHTNISFDFSNDTLSVYLNGSRLVQASISSIFGTSPGKPLQIPSFKKTGDVASFDYPGAIPASESVDFVSGPRTDPFFTPWIVGGGWTDGIPLKITGQKAGGGATRDYDLNVRGYTGSVGQFVLDASSIRGGFSGPSNGLYSGLGGHLGSLKIYSKPLSNNEVVKNYDAHKNFFENIQL